MNTKKKLAREVLGKNVGRITFGMYLRVARDLLGLTQEEMGKKLNISRSAVCEIEKGRHMVRPKLALKIAKKAGLSPTQAVKLCLQDQLDRDKINMSIDDLTSVHTDKAA